MKDIYDNRLNSTVSINPSLFNLNTFISEEGYYFLTLIPTPYIQVKERLTDKFNNLESWTSKSV